MTAQKMTSGTASYSDLIAQMTAPGSPFELEEAVPGQVRRFAQRPQNLGQLFPRIEAYGDQECIIFGDERISYVEFADRIRRLASGLSAIGEIGDRVAILGANHPDWIASFWAALLAGMTPVALNGWWRGAELSHGLQLTGASILIGDQKRIGKMPAEIVQEIRGRLFMWDEEGDEFGGMARPLSALLAEPLTTLPELDEHHPASMMFTSGTTGRAKAAVISHGAWIAASMNIALTTAVELARAPHLNTATSKVKLLASLPFFHVGGGQGAVLGGLIGGQTIVIPHGRFDASETLRVIAGEKITRWSAVPAMVHKVCLLGNRQGLDLSTLTTLGYGAAPSHPNLRERAQALFPSLGAVSNAYGLTETSGIIAMNTGIDLENHPGSVGRAFATADIRIVDEYEDELPVGEKGEVQVRGPFVMSGYWNDPEETAKMISPEGWLRTGDVGRLDTEGFLYLLGRKKDIIIRGGENISAEEVEHCIESHPEVNEVAVVAMSSDLYGEEVRAIVRLKREGTVNETVLQEWVGGALSHFKIPSVIEFTGKPLPRNAAGKLLKNELRGSANSQFDEFFS
ncbi:class I adenylate-forming enzyme family protein [Parvularcula marina]